MAQWIPSEKGIYQPPPKELFPHIKCRTIKISNYIDRNISHFIGKDGKNFIDWTKRFNVLYIFYRDQQIEIWGEHMESIHHAIHFIIDKIKNLNEKRKQYYENIDKLDEQTVSTT